MAKYVEQLSKLVLITFCGVAASVIIGLMVYGGEVFNISSVGFSFVSFGLSGAFIFAFYHVRGLSETITAAVVVSAAQFIITTSWINPVNAALWSFGVNLPIILVAFLFERKLQPIKRFKFVVVSLLYGATFVTVTLLVALVNRVELLPPSLFRHNFVDGLFIGLGIALGIEAGGALIHSWEHWTLRHQSVVQKK